MVPELNLWCFSVPGDTVSDGEITLAGVDGGMEVGAENVNSGCVPIGASQVESDRKD